MINGGRISLRVEMQSWRGGWIGLAPWTLRQEGRGHSGEGRRCRCSTRRGGLQHKERGRTGCPRGEWWLLHSDSIFTPILKSALGTKMNYWVEKVYVVL